jgi:hypothetical protein
MVKKPDYILDVEKNDGVLSIMRFHMFDGFALKYLDEKKYERVFEEGSVKSSGKAKWLEVIYKTAQPFYLHFMNDTEDDEQYCLNIYYKPDRRNELIFFTTQVLKPIKDGTNNDTTTEGQNQ